jgi:GNAT superfamily N-acetyltransferase
MQINLRPATPADVPQILAFIRDLATYEREPDAVQATEADLLRDGFGPTKRFDCIIADMTDGEAATPAGFALYFHNYSTWRGHAGIYLEDIYVTPEHRGKGIGKALLTRVAAIAVAEGCPRYEWAVLDWNQPSIDFYHSLGAVMKSEWKGMQVSGEALTALAAQSTSAAASQQKVVILSGAKNPRISSEAPPITISKESN